MYRYKFYYRFFRVDLGWGLPSPFPPFRYPPDNSAPSKHALAVEYHVYIGQVSPQLSCGDTCQILMWLRKSNKYVCKIKKFSCGENNERSSSSPHPSYTLFPGSVQNEAGNYPWYLMLRPTKIKEVTEMLLILHVSWIIPPGTWLSVAKLVTSRS